MRTLSLLHKVVCQIARKGGPPLLPPLPSRERGPEAAGTGRLSRRTGKLLCAVVSCAILLSGSAASRLSTTTQHAHSQPASAPGVRFPYLDVYFDAGARPLAAYQFELIADPERVKIVGVEGGEHAAFAGPPYYDPAALQDSRIIIAAFNIGKSLPVGKTRIARLHLYVTGAGEPEYEIKLQAAASADGGPVEATVTWKEGVSQ